MIITLPYPRLCPYETIQFFAILQNSLFPENSKNKQINESQVRTTQQQRQQLLLQQQSQPNQQQQHQSLQATQPHLLQPQQQMQQQQIAGAGVMQQPSLASTGQLLQQQQPMLQQAQTAVAVNVNQQRLVYTTSQPIRVCILLN